VAVLPQLIDPHAYRPCDWDLKRDPSGLAYWIDHFCRYLDVLTPLIVAEYPATSADALEAFRREYLAAMQAIGSAPERYEHVDVLLLVETREVLLRRHGFADPFLHVKERENAAALELLPELLRELDAEPPAKQMESLAIGLMAGNMFDLGSMATVDRYRSRLTEFRQTRAEQPRRPWLIDDVDAWQRYWTAGRGYRHAVFFVDNAGSDICLGCIPFVRSILRADTHVTLAANSEPALNDVTAPELHGLLKSIATIDGLTREACDRGQLSVVASGGAAPLLDLSALSPECATAAVDADLIILHGMGRGVESNRLARFRSGVLRTAVLKDAAVAGHVDGRLFDCVFQHVCGQGG
jgi:uncharacterized protein with ATP-grasp and redox domains